MELRAGGRELAALALPRALTDPLAAAAALVAFALESGGMDNVTVVLAPFPLRSPAVSGGDPAPREPGDPAPRSAAVTLPRP